MLKLHRSPHSYFFFFNDTATTEIYTLSLHDALPICKLGEENPTCSVETGRALVEAGLHPATGGDGRAACSGDLLLEALVACAGVTLKAVATALALPLDGGTVSAEGDLDFRGTLGVAKDVPVGFQAIRLRFDLDTDASPEQLDSLLRLTERYCVVYQTLQHAASVTG